MSGDIALKGKGGKTIIKGEMDGVKKAKAGLALWL